MAGKIEVTGHFKAILESAVPIRFGGPDFPAGKRREPAFLWGLNNWKPENVMTSSWL
jgi:hypothetical protein